MKSSGGGGGGGGGGGELLRSVNLTASSANAIKRSLRLPFILLFLIAVTTVVSCRTAVRRSMTYQPLEQLASGGNAPLLNSTLLRLASIDVGEVEERKEIEELLDSAGLGYGGEATHQSISSWRRFHRLDMGRRDSSFRLRSSLDNPIFAEFRRALRGWSRNRRFHPGVMSELLDLVKRPIDKHRGALSSELGHRYGSCAVVGNSGILLQHDHGELIDGHDLVIRLNNARTHGFSRNVGTKTGLSFVNSNILQLCARRETCFCHPYGEDIPLIMYICQPVHFLDYTVCNASHKAPLLITDARFDRLCSRIIKYYSLKRFVEEMGRAPEEWDKTHDVKMFHYSSGMQAIMLAVGICDEVSIFGFGKSAGAKHHYHTNQKEELDLHDYEAEYAFYRDLIERPQVIPFLSDSGFKVPPVVIYR